MPPATTAPLPSGASTGSPVPTNRRGRRILLYATLALLAVAAVAVIAFVVWALNGPEPLPEALAALESDAAVTVTGENPVVFTPTGQSPTCGYIFYPGGKVSAPAYAPPLRAIAAEGILVVLPSMPLNLAVLAPNRAATLIPAFPRIERWVIGGHSLGGAMAASYASGHPSGEPDGVEGLVLWASFPPAGADLSARTDLTAGSLYATNDGLATVDDIEASRALLPPDTRFTAIQGGNHAQFGWYGPQDGDGEATIAREEQMAQTVAATLEIIRRSCGD